MLYYDDYDEYDDHDDDYYHIHHNDYYVEHNVVITSGGLTFIHCLLLLFV